MLAAGARPAAVDSRRLYSSRFLSVRRATERLARVLSAEDQSIQSMPDVSPTKWHLAHTTWFFETFLLKRHLPDYRETDPRYAFLFNSYYEAAGKRHERAERGLISRPGVAEILEYREQVTAAMETLIAEAGAERWRSIEPVLEIGLAHEEQHQELILMDIKHVLWCNPFRPAYGAPELEEFAVESDLWLEDPGGLLEIGADSDVFAFDSERPRHRVWLEPFRLAPRPVSCGEYLQFMQEGGYGDPANWLSDGWDMVRKQGWCAPLYWQQDADGNWLEFTLSGLQPLRLERPVRHVSYYEADAFARWRGLRLPSEAEWEMAARLSGWSGQGFAPAPPATPYGAYGDSIGKVWEWTASAYSPYPGFRPLQGALGEYNGKFMSGQMVLRGASALTPLGHSRPSYRNFFPPSARWVMSGIRLAESM